MSRCRYCNLVELVWPENYVKGMKPLEEDTHIEHNYQRCQEMQGISQKKDGWIRRVCKCGSVFLFHRKHFTEKTIVMDCEMCTSDKDGKLT